MLKLLDLFSGIGGFSLGLERTGGFETVAFCEIDKFCQKVLRKHWPNVRQYTDIKTLTAVQLTADGITVDAICGGFPCQDISLAGGGAGMGEGTRSGLWSEYARLIGELRPRYVIVENVSALLGRGLDRVLGDLAQIGYDAEWHCIPAAAVGAPHRRDRVWIVAYAESRIFARINEGGKPKQRFAGLCEDVPHANSLRKLQPQGCKQNQREWLGNSSWWDVEPDVGRVANGVPLELDIIRRLKNESDSEETIAAANQSIRQVLFYLWSNIKIAETSPDLYRKGFCDCLPRLSFADTQSGWLLGARIKKDEGLCNLLQTFCSQSFHETQDLQRDLLECLGAFERREKVEAFQRVNRLKSLGNAVVPQIPELIGRAILSAEAASPQEE